jgi:hypothetical protein
VYGCQRTTNTPASNALDEVQNSHRCQPTDRETEIQVMAQHVTAQEAAPRDPVSFEAPSCLRDGGEVADTIYLLKLGISTNLRWLTRENPDVVAARRTAERMSNYISQLETLMKDRN